MGRTLFEMLFKSKGKTPPELRLYNPLGLRIGDPLTVSISGCVEFVVAQVRECTRHLDGHDFLTTEYVLKERKKIFDNSFVMRLRLNPLDDPDADAGLTHHYTALSLYDEMGYDEGFQSVLDSDTNLFEVKEGDTVTERYWRVNDVSGPYETQVRMVSKGDLDLASAAASKIAVWDYWRELKDEAGQPYNEFLFVEKDLDSGWFQLWRGQEIESFSVKRI